MKIIDIVIIIIILLILVLAIRKIIKDKGKCAFCNHDCANCLHFKQKD